MRIDVVTLFPELLEGPLRTSIIGRAVEAGLVEFGVHDLREHGLGRHRSVDDYPYGGGAGMVMRPEPLFAAVQPLRDAGADGGAHGPRRRAPHRSAWRVSCPRSRTLPWSAAATRGSTSGCGPSSTARSASATTSSPAGSCRPSCSSMRSCASCPGVIAEASHEGDSFASGLLEYPQYTRPEVFGELPVPPVLLSGHHGEVDRWRRREALRRTLERRPDLLESATLTDADRAALDELREVRRLTRARALPLIAAPLLYSPASRPPSRSRLHVTSDQPRARPRSRGRPRMNAIKELEREQLRDDVPEIAPGDTVRVSVKVVEGSRERIQVFEGTVMRMRGGGLNRAITVRRIASGVGVERTFMVHAPRIEKIEVVRHGVARRAQLYFLRDRVGKSATLRERRAT